MVDVRRVTLPGVGVLHSFETADGAEVAVVAHRTGRSELVSRPVGSEDDDDSVTVRLDEDEAHTLAEILGGTRIVESIAELDELPGVPIDWVTVDAPLEDVLESQHLHVLGPYPDHSCAR